MEKTLQTPAPWRISKDGCYIEDEIIPNTIGVIARIDFKPLGIREANARLIASAPELLQSLKELCVLTAEIIDASNGKKTDCPALVKAMSLIARL